MLHVTSTYYIYKNTSRYSAFKLYLCVNVNHLQTMHFLFLGCTLNPNCLGKSLIWHKHFSVKWLAVLFCKKVFPSTNYSTLVWERGMKREDARVPGMNWWEKYMWLATMRQHLKPGSYDPHCTCNTECFANAQLACPSLCLNAYSIMLTNK